MTGRVRLTFALAAAGVLLALVGAAGASYIEEEFSGKALDRLPPRPEPPRPDPPPIVRPPNYPQPAPGHVPELARYLDRLDVRRPAMCGRLAVFPVTLRGGEGLGGRWLTMDAAISRGTLVVREKDGGGTVPVIWMENRSQNEHVFIMAGEVISGGKQTRTVRQDVLLAPGQRVDVAVFCVEQHRWQGDAKFSGGEILVPQSVQREMRKGADQAAVWGEVARSNAALGVQSPTGSLEPAMKSAPVRRELESVRRAITPDIRGDSVGFIFVDRSTGRTVGAEFFGRSDLAMPLLGKLLDAYAVDLVVGGAKEDRAWGGPPGEDVARGLLDWIRRAGSYRAETPGSGAGIRMRAAGLVGDGVSLGGDIVHFGCQAEAYNVPVPPYRRGVE